MSESSNRPIHKLSD